MKKLITISAIAFLGLASCKKENVEPELVLPQKVTYMVKCTGCLVYVDDTLWNQSSIGDQSQHFVVNGNFKYSFDNTKLDSVRMKIYVGTFLPQQDIESSITTTDNRKVEFVGRLGSGVYPEKNLPYEKNMVLKLK